ncbi:putative LRR receptor-like serine/threonine-protein kinase [Camellia lanceoleosa]|uniref:LRR receptor-like serine/threonine-protein kinase n=1 Tax=Camellia lanceoleosa TaxID=1840588 RepID=A0ACC0IUU3_9ERIC|nr:putative LRR receptor-like serine/threonine-protein kinase [Camellia lanceoleosa]
MLNLDLGLKELQSCYSLYHVPSGAFFFASKHRDQDRSLVQLLLGIYNVEVEDIAMVSGGWEFSSPFFDDGAATVPRVLGIVNALNTIFGEWGLSASNQWNISGEPCSGAAIDSTSIESTNGNYNPGIKCDCNRTTCHITRLKVYALDVVGVIPEELWTLTFLINLDLRQNYLTGSLSASIGNLSRMQYLTVGINALSGELPKELGKLTDLRSLYFVSSGVSGAIPSTFAALRNLQTVRFQGNSFGGPIPTTFSNLTLMEDLRISDLSNGSSSLVFLKDMKSLNLLILRNNNISGSIPSNIGDYQRLLQLDLSFNNLTGQIPDSLFNLSSLSYLFLGNNKLTGTLPAQKSTPLLNIDLSYNELSGSFPSWINQQDLQLNLVANNFTIEGSNNSVLPSGLSCLQRNFPCYRNVPVYSNFAVKCGGPQITSSKQIIYERDNETLGPATYYVTSTNRWAVSNVGRFGENNNAQYTSFSSSQFTNTLDSELFQTARISAGSLRYYGLGLENGNYTVNLQFVELTIENPTTWKSLGRRVFDIYIQGNLEWKDFDLRKEAGGASLQPVQKEFKAQVSENYLEIHLFWAGKGTCCVPTQGTYGPSISAISVTSDFIPTVSNNLPTSKKNKTSLTVGIVVPIGVVCLLLEQEKIYLLEWAWHLHEINHEVKLVDANLSEFHEEEVKRVIGVALLCTQTSPMLRPSMSRVVGMLSGDFEVSAITTRPGYLTDWNFNDTTSFMSNDTPTVKKEHSHYSSSTRTSMVVDPDRSPINDAKPVLQEIIGEGIGLLIVPYALSSGGWLSFLLFFIISPMTFYTGLLLKTCLDADPSIRSYLNIAEQAIGKTCRIIVTIIMNSELYLVGMGLLILEADNLHKLFPKFMIKIGTLTVEGTQSFVFNHCACDSALDAVN